MIAIGPPPDDAQSQIDLGERPLGARRRHLLSTAAGPLRLGNVGCFLGQSAFELVLDLDEIVRLGLEITRMRPLEAGLNHATDLPVGVAQMVVDGRILGLELDSMLEKIQSQPAYQRAVAAQENSPARAGPAAFLERITGFFVALYRQGDIAEVEHALALS